MLDLMISQLCSTTLNKDAFHFLREYSALLPARLISFPSHLTLTEINNLLVDLVLFNPHFRDYPPSRQYQKNFWKIVISRMEEKLSSDNEARIEASDEEIDFRILDHYLSLLPPSGPHSGSTNPNVRDQICGLGLPAGEKPSKSFLTHFWKLRAEDDEPEGEYVDVSRYQTLTLNESRTTIESGTTGLRTWLASHALSQFLIKHPEFVQGQCVLELGCGIGFLGIVIASLQLLSTRSKTNSSKSIGCVWLTDVNENVLSQCHYNIQLPCNLSSNHANVQYRTLDWSEALEPDVSVLEHLLQDVINPDIVVGADIVFDPNLVPALIAVIKLALRSDKKQFAIISLTVRNKETYRHFLNTAEEQKLIVDELQAGDDEPMFLDTVEGGNSKNEVKILQIKSQVTRSFV